MQAEREQGRKSNNRGRRKERLKAGREAEERNWRKSERPASGGENSCTAYCFLTHQLKCFIKVLNPFSKYIFFALFCLFFVV